MDDSLLAELQSTLTCVDVHSTYTPHPHYTLYKQHKDGYTNQEVRRKKILENQKARRRDMMDYARRIVEGEEGPDEEDLMEEGAFDEVDTTMEEVKKPVSEVKSVWPVCSRLYVAKFSNFNTSDMTGMPRLGC